MSNQVNEQSSNEQSSQTQMLIRHRCSSKKDFGKSNVDDLLKSFVFILTFYSTLLKQMRLRLQQRLKFR